MRGLCFRDSWVRRIGARALLRLCALALLAACSPAAATPQTIHVSAGYPALPDTSSGVHIGLSATPDGLPFLTVNGKQYRDLTGYDYVYAARHGGPTGIYADVSWNNAFGGPPWQEYYQSFAQDQNYTGGPIAHDLAWYRANHPDWVLYQADRATPGTYNFGNFPDRIAIDYGNPAVQLYIYTTYLKVALNAGFKGISFDDNTSYNLYGAVGCYCGANGGWQQLFSGDREDARWSARAATGLQGIARLVKADFPNASITIEDGWFPQWDTTAAIWDPPVRYADMIEDEGGWWINGTGQRILAQPGKTTPNAWLDKMNKYIALGKGGMGFFFINQLSYNINQTDSATNAQTRSDLQWALANYLMVKYQHDYTAMYWAAPDGSGGYTEPTKLFPEYRTANAIGRPINDMHQTYGVYFRDYTGGVAIVNPDPSRSYSFLLPPGQYKDLYGNVIGQVTMAPGTALVLLLTSG